MESYKEIFDYYNIKEILILENQFLDEAYKTLVDRITNEGFKVHVVENASAEESKIEIFKALKTIDTIFFESSFIYKDTIFEIGQMLKAIKKPLKIFAKVRSLRNETILGALSSVFNDEQMAEFSHHELFEVENFTYLSLIDSVESFATKTDLLQFKIKIEEATKEKFESLKRAKLTGREIRIGKINTPGKEFEHLKEGDVVDEIDNYLNDPVPDYGVWVKGATEPVKLLNNRGVCEWEFEQPNSFELALEILSMLGAKTSPFWVETLPVWINKSLSKLKDSEVHYYVTHLLDTHNVERRYYRNLICEKLIAYKNKHIYFGDDSVEVRFKIKQYLEGIKKAAVA